MSGDHVYSALFSLTDEAEMGHIELSRQADVVLVMPATANMLAKMAHGIADDLVSTILMCLDKPVIVVPSMNVRMWEHHATQRNIRQLLRDGVQFIGPVQGDMACGEYGYGRMVEPDAIVQRVEHFEKRRSCVLILGSIPKIDADGLLYHVPAQKIQDDLWEVLHTYHIEIWCGRLKEPCSIPHERVESEQDVLMRMQKEERPIFSLGQWVSDVPDGVHDLSAESDPIFYIGFWNVFIEMKRKIFFSLVVTIVFFVTAELVTRQFVVPTGAMVQVPLVKRDGQRGCPREEIKFRPHTSTKARVRFRRILCVRRIAVLGGSSVHGGSNGVSQRQGLLFLGKGWIQTLNLGNPSLIRTISSPS